MKLYFSPGACSLAIHILLQEIDKPFSTIKVNLSTHKTEKDEDYYTINPRGSVPFLVLDNGEYLSEGPIIAQYICDQAQRHDLMPAANTMARYRVMEWQNYITSELHKTVGLLFKPSLDAQTKSFILDMLKNKFNWLSTQLKNKQYLTGDTFTAADAYLFTVANWTKHTGPNLTAYPVLTAYLARVAARPAVQKVLKAEGLKTDAPKEEGVKI